VGIVDPDASAGCTSAVAGDDDTICMGYLTLIQAASLCK